LIEYFRAHLFPRGKCHVSVVNFGQAYLISSDQALSSSGSEMPSEFSIVVHMPGHGSHQLEYIGFSNKLILVPLLFLLAANAFQFGFNIEVLRKCVSPIAAP
jgi:hypothetical protein